MPNNKGFAISSVLYLLLVAFLMFLMLLLAQFTSSTSIIGKANDDLINGTKFEVMQIKDSNKRCIKYGDSKQPNDIYRYESGDGELLVRIKSRYGTMYWPKDFGLKVDSSGNISGSYHQYKNIDVLCLDGSNCEGKNIFNVTYTNKELEIQLNKITYTTPNWTYNGGTIVLKDENVDKFKDIFNNVSNKEKSSFECSTNIIKNKYSIDGCNEIKKYREINFDEKDGFIKLYLFGSLISKYGFEAYMWDLPEPISFTHFENDNGNEAGTINRIFYTIYDNGVNGALDLSFYHDDEELFAFNLEKLKNKINDSSIAESITTDQKLKITDLKTGKSIDNLGLHDICE